MNIENRIGKWSVIFGIVIVLNLFFNYALSLVYKQPSYESFCQPQAPVVSEPMRLPDKNYDDCWRGYDEVNNVYSRNVFVTLVILGALSVLAGNFLKGNLVISNGLALGGLLSFIVASMRFWGTADDIFRVVILVISLGILFWIAYKKFNERVRPERN